MKTVSMTSSAASENAAPVVAKQVGLRYVGDHVPGIFRLPDKNGFRYIDADGKAVRDEETLARIKSLTIRRHGVTSGSAPGTTATSKPPGATPNGASNTATIHAGAACATTPSTNAC